MFLSSMTGLSSVKSDNKGFLHILLNNLKSHNICTLIKSQARSGIISTDKIIISDVDNKWRMISKPFFISLSEYQKSLRDP